MEGGGGVRLLATQLLMPVACYHPFLLFLSGSFEFNLACVDAAPNQRIDKNRLPYTQAPDVYPMTSKKLKRNRKWK